jgi:hypothetical protein
MWKHATSFFLLMLAGVPAIASAQCPEFIRLRGEVAAAAAPRQTLGVAARERCDAYIRLSVAWGELARYAGEHREACDISPSTLNDIEKRKREVVQAQNNVCAGRPFRPFPAEIILR